MAVHGARNVKRNARRVFKGIDRSTTKVLTAIAITGAGYAKLATPVDTAALINSQYYRVDDSQAIVGYTGGFTNRGFNYGLYLNNNDKWSPVKKKNASPMFLSDAFESEQYQDDYRRIIVNGYKL